MDRVGRKHCLVVLGSLNANIDDRSLSRESIRPVQVLMDDDWEEITIFSEMGELGMSSFCLHLPSKNLFFSTGQQIEVLDLASGRIQNLPLGRIRDVHEMTAFDNSIWIANTGMDEAVEIDAFSLVEKNRYSIKPDSQDIDSDKFHMNQIFFDFNDDPICLVHHVKGKQFFRQVKGRLLKKQGDGGFVRIHSGKEKGLGLRAPHSIISNDDSYWIMNSGDQEINVYNQDWKLTKTFPSSGWGRGAEFSPDGKLAYVGISPIRRRYAGLIKESTSPEPIVQVFDSASGECLETIQINGIEQINNLYIFEKKTISTLRGLE